MPDLALSALPIAFDFDGKTYQVSPRTLGVEALFAKHHADQTYQDLQVFADTLGPVALAQQVEGWRHDLSCRAFSFGTWLSRRYLASEDGFRKMAWLLIERGAAKYGGCHIDMPTLARIARDVRVIEGPDGKPVLTGKGPELAKLVEEISDPNRPALMEEEAQPSQPTS